MQLRTSLIHNLLYLETLAMNSHWFCYENAQDFVQRCTSDIQERWGKFSSWWIEYQVLK